MRMKVLALAIVSGCALATLADAQAPDATDKSMAIYVASLHPMNTKVTGRETTGEARFAIMGNTLMISVNVHGAPADTEHWQHFHGFKDNRDAVCPTEAADANHDGIIDLIETEPASGTTMVPLNDDPVGMKVATNTYPKASADGSFQYQKAVSLRALKAAFAKAFGDRELDLDRRVVFIHGVPSATDLPASVASLGTIPAQVTLPIACGKIERVAG